MVLEEADLQDDLQHPDLHAKATLICAQGELLADCLDPSMPDEISVLEEAFATLNPKP